MENKRRDKIMHITVDEEHPEEQDDSDIEVLEVLPPPGSAVAKTPSAKRTRNQRTSTPTTGAPSPTSPSGTMDEAAGGSRSSPGEEDRGKSSITTQWLTKLFGFFTERSRSPRAVHGVSPLPGGAPRPEAAAEDPRPGSKELTNQRSPERQSHSGRASPAEPENVQGRILA